LLVVAGIANSVYLMFNQVMIQLTVDDEYRGRVAVAVRDGSAA